jgi:hypothetical protein
MTLAVTILGSLCVAAIAAVITHRFTSRRDLANRRKDLRTQYLLSAYRAISASMNRNLRKSAQDARALEQGLSDIQLLGSKEQAGIAAQVGRAMTSDGEADPADLLLLLRNDLRDELELDPLFEKPVTIRIVAEDTIRN